MGPILHGAGVMALVVLARDGRQLLRQHEPLGASRGLLSLRSGPRSELSDVGQQVARTPRAGINQLQRLAIKTFSSSTTATVQTLLLKKVCNFFEAEAV